MLTEKYAKRTQVRLGIKMNSIIHIPSALHADVESNILDNWT